MITLENILILLVIIVFIYFIYRLIITQNFSSIVSNAETAGPAPSRYFSRPFDSHISDPCNHSVN